MAPNAFVKNSFEAIRSKLSEHRGGSVVLQKNEDTGIAQIILDHQEKRNAFSGRMMVDFRDCVEELEKWFDGKGVIVRGLGPVFCSGGDLNFARVSNPQNGFDMSVWMQDALVRLQKLPLVSCCLVHGACLGGGSELSVFCDYIVAADDVRYGFVQGKMGITTAWGGGTRLALRVGQRKALDLLLTCRVLNAKELVSCELADAVVSTETALDETVAWLNAKLQLHSRVTRALKSQLVNYNVTQINTCPGPKTYISLSLILPPPKATTPRSEMATKLVRNTFENIRHELLNFVGGRIFLEKNDDSGVAQIILDRPEKRNALSGQMMVDLRDCVESLEKWVQGKAVILSGRGSNFCSGADLDFVKVSNPQGGMDMSVWMQDALVRLQKLPLVSCCLVHGASLGGGSELAVFCDYVVAADDVKYGFVQGKMGITTAWGGGTRLTQRVGRRTALELLLTSKLLNAQECLKLGVVDLVVSRENALRTTEEWFGDKLRHETEVVRAIKSIVCNAQSHSYEDSLVTEREIFAPLWGGPINKRMLTKNIKHL